MNAFSEIQVTPVYSHDGMQSNGKSVRIADEESAWVLYEVNVRRNSGRVEEGQTVGL